MKNLKAIGSRAIVVILLMVVFNFIYKRFFFEKDIKAQADIINILPEPQDSAQILYFAESSNFTSHKFDEDKRSIGEMIAANYPDKKMVDVHKGALHAGIYKVLLQHIPEENTVETVIITLNLRSFGADWIYSKLETSLQKSMVLLQAGLPLINRIALSFKGYDVKTKKERHEQVIRAWKKEKLNFPYDFEYPNTLAWEKGLNKKGFWFADGAKDYDKTALSCHYVKSYAFSIDDKKNPRVKDFDEIVAFCAQRKWNLVFNLMAENTEKAKELVGDDLLFIMNRNRNFLIDRYQKKGVIVVDNLNDVPTQYFIDQNWTTEHYTEEGRRIIAINVADSLKKIHPNHYHKATVPELKQKSYFQNNCEQESDWKNSSTLCDEKSYSGKFSSKTSASSPYSITLEKALKYIPDSTKNRVHLKVMSFTESNINPIKAVVEFQGDYIQTKWLILPLQLKEKDQWNNQHLTFDLSGIQLTEYNLIKVYCSNKEGAPVYLDNWEVTFE